MKISPRAAFGIHPLPSPVELQIRVCSFGRQGANRHTRGAEPKQRRKERKT